MCLDDAFHAAQLQALITPFFSKIRGFFCNYLCTYCYYIYRIYYEQHPSFKTLHLAWYTFRNVYLLQQMSDLKIMFYAYHSVHRESILKKFQQDDTLYSTLLFLVSRFTYFGRNARPSSGARLNCIHSICGWQTVCVQPSSWMSQEFWYSLIELLMMGVCYARNM
jgi:hypothetical protein